LETEALAPKSKLLDDKDEAEAVDSVSMKAPQTETLDV